MLEKNRGSREEERECWKMNAGEGSRINVECHSLAFLVYGKMSFELF